MVLTMKKVIIVACLTLISIFVNAQDTYFQTDFSSGMPDSFTLHDEDGRTPSTDMQNLGFAVGTAWIVTTEGNDNNSVACSTSWYKNAGQANDWMVTGAILIRSDKAVLRWRARASDKDYSDGYKVYISEKGTDVADFDTSSPMLAVSKEHYAWTEHSINLADYVGKTVYIAFVNDSKDKTCLYVDDIFVGVPSHVGLTLNLGRITQKYGDIALSGKAFSTDESDIEGYIIGYRIDGQTYEQHYSGTLKSGRTVDFTLDRTFHIDRNQTLDYEAWIKSGNDSTGLKGRLSAYPWKIVAEEVTGTWCGYCVRGIVAMRQMKEAFPDSFIGIAVHNSTTSWPDAMAAGVEDYLDNLFSSCNISGYPHCVLNRNPMYSIDPSEMEDYYYGIMSTSQNNCGIELSATYDEATDKVSTVADLYFAEDVSNADYKLAYVFIENNVHRTNADLGIPEGQSTGYEQNNYYSGNAYGRMGGFESLPATVPADEMWYNDVARAIYPSYDGEPCLLPTDIHEGDHFSLTYTMDVPTTVLERGNVELAVLLIDKNNVIANADKVGISGLTSGINNASIQSKPSSDSACYDLTGRRIAKPTRGLYITRGHKIIAK